MRRELGNIDIPRLRAAVADLVTLTHESDWLYHSPDEVLLAAAAPFEVLTFHYYLDPPKDQHLIRAARVMCEALADHVPQLPTEVASAFHSLRREVGK